MSISESNPTFEVIRSTPGTSMFGSMLGDLAKSKIAPAGSAVGNGMVIIPAPLM